ncbi:MAG: hypothetical protein KatS3mg057_2929 [Herpetosiphonaceae bacterium]|nr:MAG: hypothetical protein KatS3mg057_2929 [Herpetosiphonaceae bacterium]
MFKPIIRLLAFFGKEVNEIRRQPRLVLSLILGPFLILLLFGLGYQGQSPVLRTILVVPPERLDDPEIARLQQAIGPNFEIVDVTSDEAAAMRRLQRNDVDVVEILPPDLEERVFAHGQSPVMFKYNEINPMEEQWILYLSYVQVIELNRAILREATGELQTEAQETRQMLAEAREQLDSLSTGLSAAKRQETRESLRRVKDAVGALAASPLLVAQMSTNGGSISQTREELLQLHEDLETLDQALSDNRIEEQQERIEQTRERIARIEGMLEQFSSVPPDVLTSPLLQRVENIRGESLELMIFYAPGVVALILQHIAVTLGALSLVRERLLGALEIYGVAPVSTAQVLLGKTLGYTLFIGIMTVVLIGLMFVLEVPFLGSVLSLIVLMAIFIPASLGVGFLISTLSSSDSQAVQLSMLVLLLSMFFSGFFLPLESFWEPVANIGLLLPLTHAITGLQNLMLRGIAPGNLQLIMLSIIAAVTFGLTWILWRRQFRRI